MYINIHIIGPYEHFYDYILCVAMNVFYKFKKYGVLR